MIFTSEYEVVLAHVLGGVGRTVYRGDSKFQAMFWAWWYWKKDHKTLIMKKSHCEYTPWKTYSYGRFT